MDIEERAGHVSTLHDFMAFLDAFAAECTANSGTWENATLEQFVDTMARWAHDMDGYYANRGERIEDQSPWRVMADILMAARIYE